MRVTRDALEPRSNERILRFYDDLARVRGQMFDRSPVLAFEQTMRQGAVKELIGRQRVRRALDMGCGDGRDGALMEAVTALVVYADLSMEMLRGARRRLGGSAVLVRASAEAPPFRSGSFDRVLASEVLEHVPAWETALAELRRILREGGRMVVTTPNRRSLYGLDRWIEHRLRRWLGRPGVHPYDDWKTARELAGGAKRVGLRVIDQRGMCYLPGYMVAYRLPARFQRWLVRPFGALESFLGRHLSRFGYMVGIALGKVPAPLDRP